MKYSTCPHCGRSISQWTNHVARCVKSPAIMERNRAALDAGDGVIVSVHKYARIAARQRSSSVASLMHMFGDWPAVAAAHGLASRPSVYGPKAKAPTRAEIQAQELDDLGREHDAKKKALWAARHYDAGLQVCRRQETEREIIFMLR